VDSLVADPTDCIKLVLWENAIDQVKEGKSYHIENCKVRVFDDLKYLNTNEFTKISEIDDIVDVNLSTPELKSNLITGVCVGVDIKRSDSCISCNTVFAAEIGETTLVKCPHCKLSMLASSTKPKLVCELVINVEGKLSCYTAFNDAIQSFCRIVEYNATAGEVDDEQLTIKLLTAGPQKLLVDKSAKKICQFLPIN
jgi:DNA-directed RNA polymerase subunit RPC12/RpoP